MIKATENLRTRIARGRRLAQHVDDPSIRLALINLMNQMDGDLAVPQSRTT
jgi:hypothetical protein